MSHSLNEIKLKQEQNATYKKSLREKRPQYQFSWSAFSRIWTEYRKILLISRIQISKIRTRKTSNMDIFHAVNDFK